MPLRREFLAQLGGLVAAGSLDSRSLGAMESFHSPDWDLSWIDRINAAKNRVVFNSKKVDDGGVVYDAELVLNQYHEVYGTGDDATCVVIVLRSAAVAMAFNDSIWAHYAIGEQAKVTDPSTHASPTRNMFYKPQDSAGEKAAGHSISELQKRGLICLVCNRALHGWASEFAEKTKQTDDAVYTEMRANLIPGSYLVPSGIFALIRAQDAGCAYMPGE